MFEPKQKILDFDAIRLRLASPDTILDWSYGEITRPETINYRTQKPEKEGLFDERIFGPTKDWECYCGKYKRIRYKGIVCDKCGVEVTHSLVRRQRMGHIALETPASHIWFLRSVPSKLGLILDLSVQALERVVYFINYIITEVDEEAKAEILEKIKVEFKNKQKLILTEFTRSVEKVKSPSFANTTDDKQEKITKKDLDIETKKLADIRDSKLTELEEDFKATDKEIKDLKPMTIITEDDYHKLSLRYGHLFSADIGAEGVRNLLKKIDLKANIEVLEEDLKKTTGTDAKKNKLVRRLKLLKSLYKRNIKPEWMILTHIPVIPPDLRPMVALDGGRFATSDLNDLYRRVINRNNRLKRLKDLNAPEVISRNEKRMLQEAVDALIDNSARQSKTVVAQAGKKRQLKSLADILKGKQGRFRQNLLGKRIDYSGRSVIVVGPNLKLSQCGIPKRMALELFRPFVISKIIKAGYVHNIRSANRYIDSDKPEVWDILEEITKESYVLLNRAPTLHRLGIQAFQPVLIEGKAIRLHPLVCAAFNADFDGDQMAVHVPLTEEAKHEAKTIMLSSLNLLKPATGNPISNPDKDIAWGCYYITTINPTKEDEKIKAFASQKEALYAYNTGKLKLNQKIKVKFDDEIKETNVGRIIFNQVLPDKLPFYNELMTTKRIGEVIKTCLEAYGHEETVKTLDTIKELGFNVVTKSGYSWSSADLPDLPEKDELVKEGEKKVSEIEKQYYEGLLTLNEKRSKAITVWTEVKDKVAGLVKNNLPTEGPVFSMMDSGARGSTGQLTQMAGMKGLVSNPSGNIIELPIKKGFKEGLDVLEYFIATHGTRKGLADTALRTANAGYLTRRLVDVAQDVVVHEEDCGDKEGRIIYRVESERLGAAFGKRLAGRFALETLKDSEGKVIVKGGELITEEAAQQIEDGDAPEIKIRSLLKCKCRKGVCQKCYGLNLAYNKPVKPGASVGIMAAQSIGEPGTQLTMRTFHTGGVAGLDITQGLPRVEELFEARTPKIQAIMTDIEGSVLSVEEATERVKTVGSKRINTAPAPGTKVIKIKSTGMLEDVFDIPAKAKIKVSEGDVVGKGGVLFETPDGTETTTKRKGTVKIEGKKIKVAYKGDKIKEFEIPAGYVIWAKEGDEVKAGDQLTEGDLDLQELFRLKGKQAVQEYILRSILNIYFSQGQKLNDKHIEIIVRQMFSRLLIKESGETDLLPGEVVERSEFEDENEKARMDKKKEATGEEMFMGISRISLSTRSFLSAASFQETAKVLIGAATTGKVDPLEGLKENVIIGRLIPAGTGFEQN